MKRSLPVIIIWTIIVKLSEGQFSTSRLEETAMCKAKLYCGNDTMMEEMGGSDTLIDEPFGTIKEVLASDTIWRSCSCSPACHHFGTCCSDAPTAEKEVVNRFTTEEYGCAPHEMARIPLVKMCPSTYAVQGIRELCMNGEGPHSTSERTFLSYLNIYCAMCNGEVISDLSPWSWQFVCRNLTVDSSGVNGPLDTVLDQQAKCEPDTEQPQTPPVKFQNIATVFGTTTHLDKGLQCDSQYVDTCSIIDHPEMSQCLTGTVGFVTMEEEPQTIYRNLACAHCNGADGTAVCQKCNNSGCSDGRTPNNKQSALSKSFRVLVQPYTDKDEGNCRKLSGDEGNSVSCDTAIIIPNCARGQYLDYNTITCKDLCPEGTELLEGACISIQPHTITEKKFHCDHKMSYEDFTLQVSQYREAEVERHHDIFSIDMNNETVCHKCKILGHTTHANEIVKMDNNTLQFQGMSLYSVYVSNEWNATYFCQPKVIPTIIVSTVAPGVSALMVEGTISETLCGISISSLILFFITFAVVKTMRNIPGYVVAGKMFMFLMAYIFFICRDVIERTTGDTGCYAVSLLIHYCFLSAFVFTLMYACLIIRSLQMAELNSKYAGSTVFKLSLIGIFTPAVVIVPAVLADHFEWSYRPEYGNNMECFMHSRYGILIYFIGPISLFLLIAVVLYIYVVWRLRQIASATSRVRSSHREKILLCFKLITVLGFNWIFAILAAALENNITSYLFIATCTLHGLFGFLVFVLTPTNMRSLKRKLCTKKPDSALDTGTKGPIVTYSNTKSTAVSERSTMIPDSPCASLKRTPRPSRNNSPLNSRHGTPKPSPFLNRRPGETYTPPSKPKCDFF